MLKYETLRFIPNIIHKNHHNPLGKAGTGMPGPLAGVPAQ
jgi:hypothetical protein